MPDPFGLTPPPGLAPPLGTSPPPGGATPFGTPPSTTPDLLRTYGGGSPPPAPNPFGVTPQNILGNAANRVPSFTPPPAATPPAAAPTPPVGAMPNFTPPATAPRPVSDFNHEQALGRTEPVARSEIAEGVVNGVRNWWSRGSGARMPNFGYHPLAASGPGRQMPTEGPEMSNGDFALLASGAAGKGLQGLRAGGSFLTSRALPWVTGASRTAPAIPEVAAAGRTGAGVAGTAATSAAPKNTIPTPTVPPINTTPLRPPTGVTPGTAGASTTPTAAQTVTEAATAAPTAARSWFGSGMNAANQLTRHDYFTGVGAVRNMGEALLRTPGALAQRAGLLAPATPGATSQAMMVANAAMRGSIGTTIPAAIAYGNRRLNTNETPEEAAKARATDVTRRLTDHPDSVTDLYTRLLKRPADMTGVIANTVPQWMGGNDRPGVLGLYQRGLGNAGGVIGAAWRDRGHAADVAGRELHEALDAATSGELGKVVDPNGQPSLNDQYRALTQRYADAARRYQQTNNLEEWTETARRIRDEASRLNYTTPGGQGMGAATSLVQQEQLNQRFRNTAGNNENPTAIGSALSRMRDFNLRPPVGENPDGTRALRFPTLADVERARQTYGLSGDFSPESVAVRRETLNQHLAPQEASLLGLMAPPPQQDAVPGVTPPGANVVMGGGQPPTEQPNQPQAPGAQPQNPFRDAPPEVQQEMAKTGPQVATTLAAAVGVPAAALTTPEGFARAAEAAKNATPPDTLKGYWQNLPEASRILAIGGLSLAAISFLRSAFGSKDEDDEPGFLSKVLPLLGVGAAAWGLGGGTLWGPNGVSMPQMAHYKNLGAGIRTNVADLGLPFGGGPR